LSTVTLYARPECHLCDEARDALLQLRAEGADFDLEEIDIETDDELHRAYLERIPVVAVDGELVSELILDTGALRARIGTVGG
jgi:glutaredoxin